MKSIISAAILLPVVIYMISSVAYIGNYYKAYIVNDSGTKPIEPFCLNPVNPLPDTNCISFKQFNLYHSESTKPIK